MAPLSPRLARIIDALPLQEGMRVVEIGCGPGAAARRVVERIGPSGFVLAVDRSPRAIAQVEETAAALISAGRLATRQMSAEELELDPGENRYDLGFAVRVGAFDGRYPEAGERALAQLAKVLRPEGRFFIDGGDPLREVLIR